MCDNNKTQAELGIGDLPGRRLLLRGALWPLIIHDWHWPQAHWLSAPMTWISCAKSGRTHLSQGHLSPHKETAEPHYIHAHVGLWGLLEMIFLTWHMLSEVGDLPVPISQARNSNQRRNMFLEHWE